MGQSELNILGLCLWPNSGKRKAALCDLSQGQNRAGTRWQDTASEMLYLGDYVLTTK